MHQKMVKGTLPVVSLSSVSSNEICLYSGISTINQASTLEEMDAIYILCAPIY